VFPSLDFRFHRRDMIIRGEVFSCFPPFGDLSSVIRKVFESTFRQRPIFAVTEAIPINMAPPARRRRRTVRRPGGRRPGLFFFSIRIGRRISSRDLKNR